ncbi:recombinase family protein [Calidifontibacillus oryziterrae]|uniref:recombinase family protein n=1 Tax=Calidifontibacillus oryziterrae TaxID=1191699 RepID=UPI0002D62901|nr:recombinase family protein [Calidifontibacillus oryziterrae]
MEQKLRAISEITVPILEEIKKHIAVYFRVSGSSQSIEMQEARAKNWAKENGFSWEQDIEVFNENALSANKVIMENRPELMKLREAIKSGQITVLVVFARDRLARNFYEYMELVEEFLQNRLKVIFVGETVPFSYDFLVEGVHGIHIQSEGKSIASRLKVVQQLYPPKKFGYVKTDDKRGYVIDERYQFMIKSFFEEIVVTESFEMLNECLKKYKSILNRKSIEDCWQLLRTAFYAAHYPKNEDFFPLDYVPPIVSLELFKKAQVVLDNFENDFINAVKRSEEIGYFTPTCGICNEFMKHNKAKLGQSAIYQCSRHKDIQISVEELNKQIKTVLTTFINSLSQKELKNIVVYSVEDAIKKLELKLKQYQANLKAERFSFFIEVKSGEPTQYIKKVKKIEQEIENLKRQLVDIRYTKTIVNQLIDSIKFNLLHKLDTEEMYNYILFLIEGIYVINHAIDFKLYCTEFSRDVGVLNA